MNGIQEVIIKKMSVKTTDKHQNILEDLIYRTERSVTASYLFNAINRTISNEKGVNCNGNNIKYNKHEE